MDPHQFKILLATDLSDVSVSALNYAMQIAPSLDAHLTLLHVIEPAGGDTVFVAEYDESILQAKNSMRALRNKYSLDEAQCDIQVEVGFPVERILHAIQHQKFSLVVMGMQYDLADIDREIFGSNAYDVVKHGKCAVLTVPQHSEAKPPKNIVLAVSLDGEENVYLLSLIKRIMGHFDSRLTLLHVTQGKHVVMEPAKAHAVQWLTDQLKGVDHTFATVTANNVSEAIHLYVEDNPTDMLVMSPETQGFLVRLLKGSSTRRTLLHSHIPLLTFPMDYV